ncbi:MULTISPECIES: TRAP transporter substrate-binding protein [unclassified Halomonas]|uniref:TRAP transporter substrate-binding protein n=1 Tax=unclassified Halomonas TaxID=2609666 RepID=UPI0005FA5734|nr:MULTISPECIES: TRAP transporter substrate-binding protein [unclassified Halomonas]MBR9879103.1 TRAP transporter substrate-binding protein [Gammaproteobacteria bacterium]MBS8269265.1 TRAP transporter substrate-binding protein [Halomonas litopenaei]HAR10075.1 C4-dicarboxylate ABC transporter substrate-binding protein [Cobetia sp.]KJZ07244.1 C4-dicarboxylate ABC transporter substrate-binding protein [Halomonas sp. S2151]MAR71027.1 C4-dicarboxylate ABC transporter substrate-binding protein [Halo|tara:strand:+ start:1136 stop:2110 length:975 start_codon:yes stop_codon:yes gene_type:complete
MNARSLTPLALVTAISLGAAGTAAAEDLAIAIHTDPSHAMFKIGERLKDTIESESDGELTVTLLGTEVGGERDHLEGASYGEYAIALGGSMPMTLYAPEFAAADLPFVYDSSDQARKIYEGEIGEALNQSLIAKGNMRLVGLSARNPRNLTSKTPVKTPEDVSEVRMRVPEIAPWVAVWGEIGALPSPIAWPEVYTSLQTGVIDMQENPVDNIYAGKLFEVQDYVSRTEHVYSFFHWLMNEDVYQELSDEHRDIVLSAIDDATTWGDQLVSDGQAELFEKLKEEGMEVVEPDVAAFRQAARPAVEEIAQDYDPAVRDYVLSLIQ